jgi:hypothetical protein
MGSIADRLSTIPEDSRSQELEEVDHPIADEKIHEAKSKSVSFER